MKPTAEERATEVYRGWWRRSSGGITDIIAEAIEQAYADGRKDMARDAVAIINLARAGDFDSDLRSVRARIESRVEDGDVCLLCEGDGRECERCNGTGKEPT